MHEVRPIGASRAAAARAPDVVIVDPNTGLPVTGNANSGTGTNTSVGDEVTSTALLAANTSRRSARIVNDSAAVLKIACGFTASATAYTARLEQNDAFFIEGFTGAINGIWESNASGSARITEFT